MVTAGQRRQLSTTTMALPLPLPRYESWLCLYCVTFVSHISPGNGNRKVKDILSIPLKHKPLKILVKRRHLFSHTGLNLTIYVNLTGFSEINVNYGIIKNKIEFSVKSGPFPVSECPSCPSARELRFPHRLKYPLQKSSFPIHAYHSGIQSANAVYQLWLF